MIFNLLLLWLKRDSGVNMISIKNNGTPMTQTISKKKTAIKKKVNRPYTKTSEKYPQMPDLEIGESFIVDLNTNSTGIRHYAKSLGMKVASKYVYDSETGNKIGLLIYRIE